MEAVLGKLSNRERGLLYLSITMLGLAVWYTYLLSPMLDRWKALSSEVASRELQYQKYSRIVARGGAAQQQYQQVVDHLKMKGSEEEEMAILLKEIEGLARGKVQITNIKPYSVTDIDFYKHFSVEVECETTIEALVRFIYEVEQAKSMLRLGRLRIQVKGESDMLNVSMSLSKLAII